MELDFDTCRRAATSRDARFDGVFVTAVKSTKIYCRPSCPAIMPKAENVRFLPTAAAAQREGFRACLRCRPDAAPGSPEWDVRGDVVGRAMRLIADGVVDRDGVPGLAGRLGYTERHLHRMLTSEVGAGPLALARAQRAQTARVLIETTRLGLAEIAFAAGFGSVRQFNDTVREIYGRTPSDLRVRRTQPEQDPGVVSVRLPFRAPLHAEALLSFLGDRAIDGIDGLDGDSYQRNLRLPHGTGTARPAPRRRPRRGHAAPRGPARPGPGGGPLPPAVRPGRRPRGRGRRAGRRPGAGPARVEGGRGTGAARHRRLRDRRARGGRAADLRRRRPDRAAPPASTGAGVPVRRGSCSNCRTPRSRCPPPGGARCAPWRPRWPSGELYLDGGGDRDGDRSPGSRRCPASATGRRSTRRCAPSATPTRSCRPTWGCCAARAPSACPTTPSHWPRTPSAGGPGVPTP